MNADKQIMFKFLNELRDSGAVNMFGATSYLAEKFNLRTEDARNILTTWMKIDQKEERKH